MPLEVLAPGSMVICKATPATSFQQVNLMFTLGMVVSGVDHDCDSVIVEWWVPPVCAKADFRRGRKQQTVDIFGQWRPMADLTVKEAREVEMPLVLVAVADILEYNFDLEEGKVPFKILDSLRQHHGIDVTGLSVSQTANGNVYRAYVLMNVG